MSAILFAYVGVTRRNGRDWQHWVYSLDGTTSVAGEVLHRLDGALWVQNMVLPFEAPRPAPEGKYWDENEYFEPIARQHLATHQQKENHE